eukprot:366354-Chlamydomonas_euryale.AAC.10
MSTRVPRSHCDATPLHGPIAITATSAGSVSPPTRTPASWAHAHTHTNAHAHTQVHVGVGGEGERPFVLCAFVAFCDKSRPVVAPDLFVALRPSACASLFLFLLAY